MRQTVKIAKLRAGMDPDRCESGHGTYYGNSLPGVYVTGSWNRRMRNTRGAFRARIRGV